MLTLVARGLSNAEIAAELELAAHGLTVARTGKPAQAWRPVR